MEILTGRDIIAFGSQDWDSHWTPIQQTMSRLAASNRVLYVDPLISPLAALKHPPFWRRWRWPGQGLYSPMNNVWVYRPLPLFLPGYEYWDALPHLNGRLCAWMLRGVLTQLNFRDPLLWIYFANSELPANLPHSLLIYDPMDEWSAAFSSARYRSKMGFVTEMDAKLCREADLVFVGSPSMLERKAPLNPSTHLVPHAVDFQHFAKATLPETAIPEDLARLPRPILGFTGSMMSLNFDASLIHELALARPQWSIALVGQVMQNEDRAIAALKETPNIYFLGMKPVRELPNYLKGFDVCLMPYKLNEFTANIYPLKQYEYLASGKPVVSTPIPAALEHREVVSVSNGEAEDFVRVIETALANDGPEQRERRIEVARRNSWEHNLAVKSELIREKLR